MGDKRIETNGIEQVGVHWTNKDIQKLASLTQVMFEKMCVCIRRDKIT